ncbi:hypothetical protein BD780_000479 [Clostridium tetanomorphum]|nr:hypothetical protein [Clostridium tetanomorphum]NRS83254.1 hypothetical protein [Clostridium tetanomorphum]
MNNISINIIVNLYYDDDCIVNVIRSVLEVALIGENIKVML